MIEQKVLETLKNEVKQRYNREVEPKLSDKLEEDLGLDSLDRIELLIDLEDETGIDFDQSVTENLQTVQDVVNLVERYKNE